MNRNPEKLSEMLVLVQALLDAGKPREALALVQKFGTGSMELANVYGVALMRTGETAEALALYRGICLFPNSVCFKPNMPTALKVNYATAVMLEGNVAGCIALLDEIGQEQDPCVQRLRAAIKRWRGSLGWWKRLTFDLWGADPGRPVHLDFAPGELMEESRLRPTA